MGRHRGRVYGAAVFSFFFGFVVPLQRLVKGAFKEPVLEFVERRPGGAPEIDDGVAFLLDDIGDWVVRLGGSFSIFPSDAYCLDGSGNDCEKGGDYRTPLEKKTLAEILDWFAVALTCPTASNSSLDLGISIRVFEWLVDTYATGQFQVTISLMITELMNKGGHKTVITIAEMKKNAAVHFPT